MEELQDELQEPKQYIVVDKKTKVIESVMDYEAQPQKGKEYIEIPHTDDAMEYLGKKWTNGKAKVIPLTAEQKLAKQVQDIEDYVYSLYPKKKQAQDLVWLNSYTTKLKASGVDNLEAQIVRYAGKIINGDTLSKTLSGINKDNLGMYEKLVKVAVRTEWAERIVTEGKLAIEEKREPKFIEMFKIKG